MIDKRNNIQAIAGFTPPFCYEPERPPSDVMQDILTDPGDTEQSMETD